MTRTRARFRRSASSVVAVGGSMLMALTGVGVAQAQSSVPTTASPAGRPTEVHAPVPHIDWTNCRSMPGLKCARVKVPLDYDKPDGATISLRIVKRPADIPAERIGSLFVNPGGPGGSAADFVGYAAAALGTPVRQRFDVIGIDPRGVAGSTPVACDAQAGDPPLPPFPRESFPIGDKQIRTWFAYDAGVRKLCAKRGNPVLDHMSTADTARDMDLIRQAVGDKMLTYYGISYGTMLGSTYAAMFPSRVRALIVDGVLDPVSWTTGRGGVARRITVSARLGSGYGAWEALTSAFAECDRVGPRLCPGAGHIGYEWNRVVAKLQAGSIKVGHTRITYADVVGNLLGGLYDSSAYPDIMRFIHQLYRQIFAGGAANSLVAANAWAALKQSVAAAGGSTPRYSGSATSARDRISPQFQGVLCSDSVNPADQSAAITSARYADERGPWFGADWAWASSTCINWPGSSADAFRGPWPTKTANPILVTGNLHDPATPISGARAVNKLFKGSSMITVNLWGHGALGHSRCVTKKWDAYLVSGKLPANGTVCQSDKPLFPGH